MVTEVRTNIEAENQVSLGMGQLLLVANSWKLSLQTPQPTAEQLAFVDITDEVARLVHQSQVALGMLFLSSRHTTCTVVINERETLLMKDVALFLDRLAPRSGYYHHNQFDIRTENMNPDEYPNGHAHCQAWLLGNHKQVPIFNGEPYLGTWQRIFVVELDSARPREVIIQVWGIGSTAREGIAPLPAGGG